MIFATVGTHNQDFTRLVKKADEIAGKIDERVVIQTGHTRYEPKNAEHFDFGSRKTLQRFNEEARIIVTHGGAGSIIFALRFHKPTIVVPRLKKFGEHINDHQLELTRELEERGKVVGVYDMDDLEKKIEAISSFEVEDSGKPRLIMMIKDYLRSLEDVVENKR
ncbi:MAG: PssE/Cps14G family polysaccharide biosynthesis glycosyltransferase [Candidatus Hydrothermarchaeales archaeon]